MKKILFTLILIISSASFAQSGLKTKNLSLIKRAIQNEYGHHRQFSTMKKWVIYNIESNAFSTHSVRKPMMVYLVDSDGEIIEQNYFIYDDDFGVYSPECNCCHLETHMFFQTIKMHCETKTCTSKPAETVEDLEDYIDTLKNKGMLVIYQ